MDKSNEQAKSTLRTSLKGEAAEDRAEDLPVEVYNELYDEVVAATLDNETRDLFLKVVSD